MPWAREHDNSSSMTVKLLFIVGFKQMSTEHPSKIIPAGGECDELVVLWGSWSWSWSWSKLCWIGAAVKSKGPMRCGGAQDLMLQCIFVLAWGSDFKGLVLVGKEENTQIIGTIRVDDGFTKWPLSWQKYPGVVKWSMDDAKSKAWLTHRIRIYPKDNTVLVFHTKYP